MILAIKRKKLVVGCILILLVLICAGVYMKFEAKIISKQIQHIIEYKLGQSMSADISIASIDTSFIGPISLNGLRLVKSTGQDTPFIFASDKVVVYINIPELLVSRLFKKNSSAGKNFAFKVENGSLSKGSITIFQDISGYGKIIDNNLIFNDIKGRCYDFPISIHGKVPSEGEKTSGLDVDIKTVSDKFSAKIHLSKSLLRPHAVGTARLKGGYKIYFSGDFDIKPGESVSVNNLMLQNAITGAGGVDFARKKVSLELAKKDSPENAVVRMVMDYSKKDFLNGSVYFNHFGIADFDLKSQLDFDAALGSSADIKIKTSGTILDSKPFKELAGEFTLDNETLTVKRLKWGESYSIAGSIKLYKPYNTDLALNINNGDLSQLLLISDSGDGSNVTGRISGQIKISGPVNNPVTVAKLECGKGNLGDLDYESLNMNLHGTGPLLKIADARILRKEGYIQLSGDMDIRQLWSKQPNKGLAWTTGNEATVWNGWDIVKQAKSQELQMKKGVGKEKEFMVTFMSYMNNEQSWQDSQGRKQNEAVSVEYNLDEAKRVKMQIKNNEEIVSLENKVKF